MKLLQNVYFIQADENANKTIKGPNGEDLYLDIDFNPYTYSTKVGTVYKSPQRCDSQYDVKDGDTVLLHHSIVQPVNKVIIEDNIYWRCAYYNIFATINDGMLKPMKDYIFVEPIEDTNTHIGKMQIKFDDKPLAKKGLVKFVGSDGLDAGIKPGDTIQYTSSADYSVKVGDKEMYRMRLRNVRFIERNGEAILLDDAVITKGGTVKYIADNVTDIKVGDSIGFFERVDPKITFKGEELLSMQTKDIIYTLNKDMTIKKIHAAKSGNRILIKQNEAKKNLGKFIIPETMAKKPSIGEVINFSTNYYQNGVHIVPICEVGDTVQYDKNGGAEIEINGEVYVTVIEGDIFVTL